MGIYELSCPLSKGSITLPQPQYSVGSVPSLPTEVGGRQSQHSTPKGHELCAAAKAGLRSRAAAADLAGKEKLSKRPAIMNNSGTCWDTFQSQNVKQVQIEADRKNSMVLTTGTWFLCSPLCLRASKAWGPLSNTNKSTGSDLLRFLISRLAQSCTENNGHLHNHSHSSFAGVCVHHHNNDVLGLLSSCLYSAAYGACSAADQINSSPHWTVLS